jgi:hypothetical protein
MTRTTIRTEDITASEVTTAKMATDPTDASNLASGTVATARLGSGTASSSTVLHGNNTWAAPEGGGLKLITSQTNNSAVASWNFGDVFSATYDAYLVTITGIVNVTGSQETRIKIGVSNLSSVETFGFAMNEFNSNGVNYQRRSGAGDSGFQYIDLNNTVGSDPTSCQLFIQAPFSSTEPTSVTGQSTYYHTGVGGDSWAHGIIGAMATSNASSASFQLQSSSGNIGSSSHTARVSVYGLAES